MPADPVPPRFEDPVGDAGRSGTGQRRDDPSSSHLPTLPNRLSTGRVGPGQRSTGPPEPHLRITGDPGYTPAHGHSGACRPPGLPAVRRAAPGAGPAGTVLRA